MVMVFAIGVDCKVDKKGLGDRQGLYDCGLFYLH